MSEQLKISEMSKKQLEEYFKLLDKRERLTTDITKEMLLRVQECGDDAPEIRSVIGKWLDVLNDVEREWIAVVRLFQITIDQPKH